MAIANLTKSTVAVNNISSLSATPNATEGLTAAQLQAKFDKTGSDYKTFINDTLTAEIDSAIDTLEAADTALSNRATVLETEASGWTVLPATLTYASATTMNTSVDLTGVIGKGDKIKLTQTNAKYFYVIAITSNLLTVTGGSDYTVANDTITSPYYSHQESPVGFPDWFNYTPTVTGFTGTVAMPVAKFKINGKTCYIFIESITGTSNAPTITFTVPVSPLISTSLVSWCAVRNNGALQTNSGHIYCLAGGSNIMAVYKTFFQNEFTASGSKGAWFPTFGYEY